VTPGFAGLPAGVHPRFTGLGQFGHSRGLPLLSPYVYGYSLYPDYLPAQPPAQPSIVVVQTPVPASAAEIPVPSQPLLIELRGDHYVQLSGETDSKAQTLAPDTPGAKIQRTPTASAVAQKPPALLVFRDGHQEEVSNYTISNGVLYAGGDYYSGGPWNLAIPVSSLDIPRTVAFNQSRGLPFRLPASPNEVIVGP
jgi:hypothetical protein